MAQTTKAQEDVDDLDAFVDEFESSREQANDTFQSSILKAMEKLQDEDIPGFDTFDEQSDGEDLQKMLEGMMQQLMSKEVLYEPLKELHDKFPAYLSDNAGALSKEDKMRYENQMDRISRILQIFESQTYKDDDPESGSQVIALMDEMQTFGSPPLEIMGSLPASLGIDPNTQNLPPDGCIIS